MLYNSANGSELGQVKDIPVVYVHYGNIPGYLKRSLQNATKYNKTVVLITEINFKFDSVKCFSIKKYTKDVDVFESVYEHLSTNSKEFEKICIARWFVLRNFMEEQKIDVCYYADSDVMIYDDLSKVYDSYREYDAAFNISESQENYRWAASASCSYWKLDTINKFCDFILNAYKSDKKELMEEKWAYHVKNKVAGGVCDMTLLYLFSKEINYRSLSKAKNHTAFDHNMFDSSNYYKDEYEMEHTKIGGALLKKIEWINGQPYGFNKITGEKVRFAVLTEYAKTFSDEKEALSSRIRNKIKAYIK
ncbi:MAG TPA: hypothetical protein VK806_01370 [Bacteroidia bacterium]|jgi:hypothetical protein|nr:hypothetical protein [Bacteroidia bacterium]